MEEQGKKYALKKKINKMLMSSEHFGILQVQKHRSWEQCTSFAKIITNTL